MHMFKQFTSAALLLMLPLPGADVAREIGMAMGPGSFTVDHGRVSGTATLFDGDLIETSSAPSTIQLPRGIKMDLAVNSRGAIYHGKMVLQAGGMVADLTPEFQLEARHLTLRSTSSNVRAMVQIGENTVQVSVLRGGLDVSSPSGALLAHMSAGTAINYGMPGAPDTVQRAVSKRVQLTGVLAKSDGHYLLREKTTTVVSELIGALPAKYVGQTLTVEGFIVDDQKPVAGADRVVRVDNARHSGDGIPCAPNSEGNTVKKIHLSGVIQKDQGHYLLKNASNGVVYEVIGGVADSQVGAGIRVTGVVIPGRQAFPPAEQVLYIEDGKKGAFSSPCVDTVVTGIVMVGSTLPVIISTGVKVVTPPISQ
jgi:hypothetical protein